MGLNHCPYKGLHVIKGWSPKSYVNATGGGNLIQVPLGSGWMGLSHWDGVQDEVLMDQQWTRQTHRCPHPLSLIMGCYVSLGELSAGVPSPGAEVRRPAHTCTLQPQAKTNPSPAYMAHASLFHHSYETLSYTGLVATSTFLYTARLCLDCLHPPHGHCRSGQRRGEKPVCLSEGQVTEETNGQEIPTYRCKDPDQQQARKSPPQGGVWTG